MSRGRRCRLRCSRRGGAGGLERREASAVGRELREQRGRLQALVPGALRVECEPVAVLREPDFVGMEHRAAAPVLTASAVVTNNVDVPGAIPIVLLTHRLTLI